MRTVHLTLGAAMLAGLAACATGGAPAGLLRMTPGASTPLRPGESAYLPDRSRLTYVAVRSDSRCPPDVTCVHAGWAEVAFGYESPTGRREALVLSTRPGSEPGTADGWRFDLVELGRGTSPLAHVRAVARQP